METVTDFIFLGSKITVDADCSHKIKRHLLIGSKYMTNWDNILKSRDIILPTNVHLVKPMVFPVVMYGCESWDYKESWAPKNWCFWTMLEKTLESPLDCKEIQPVHPKGDQSWIFIGRTAAEAETLKTLATWWEKLTHLRRPWCWERLKAGGEGGGKGWAGWMASPTQWTWTPGAGDEAWHAAVHGVAKSQTRLNWTEMRFEDSLQAQTLRIYHMIQFTLSVKDTGD